MGANNEDRVYRSIDEGLTWEPVYEGLPNISGFPSASPTNIHYEDGLLVMGGTNFILKSEDDGETWQPLDGVVGSTTYAIDKTESKWHVCTSANESNLPAYPIFYSEDQGTTWQNYENAPETDPEIGNPIAQTTNALAELNGNLFAATGSNAGDALQKSSDGGLTWEPVGDFIFTNCVRNVDGTLYVTSSEGLYSSQDGGDTWEEILDQTYFGLSVNGYMKQDGDKLWICSSRGPLYLDLNSGEVSDSGIPTGSVSKIFASNGIIAGIQNGIFYLSNDFGQSYNQINELVAEGFLPSNVTIDGNTIYASGSTNSFTEWGTYMSNDGGLTWEQMENLPGGNFQGAILSFNPMIFGVGMGEDISFHKSTDGGASWTESDINLIGDPPIPDARVQAINKYGDVIFADITKGYAYSFDDGDSWTMRATDTDAAVYGWESEFIRVYIHPLFQTKSLEHSTDQGETWESFNEGFPNNFGLHYPEGITMADGKVIVQNNPFLGAFNNPGAFYSLSEGADAYEHESELGTVGTAVLDLSGTAMNDLYASANQNGIYTNAAVSAVDEPELFNKVQVFPNPTTGQLNLNSKSEIRSVIIYDLSGKVVFEKSLNLMSAQIQLDPLISGVYLVQARTLEGLFTSKLVISKP
mgnify:CR=1 FL=1